MLKTRVLKVWLQYAAFQASCLRKAEGRLSYPLPHYYEGVHVAAVFARDSSISENREPKNVDAKAEHFNNHFHFVLILKARFTKVAPAPKASLVPSGMFVI